MGKINLLTFLALSGANQLMGMEADTENYIEFSANHKKIPISEAVREITNSPKFLTNFPQVLDGTDGNRDCEQQAILNYRIIYKILHTENLSDEEGKFLLKVCLLPQNVNLINLGTLLNL